MQTAQQLSENYKVGVFRAGIWKPRTKPHGFEGVGVVGLPWLKRVKDELGMKVGTEVANAKHVYEALKYGIDVLWIGARTSANPFAVQEIADALKGVDIPIFVKNPVNPDLELWIGAIERIHAAGITRIGAIHRGFSTYIKSPFRNLPQWQIPIELQRRIPELPILCDPSHITGRRDLLQSVAQKALDLDFDGFMIESHINPDKAWSDAKQQVTPAELDKLIVNLILRNENSSDGEYLHSLEELRANIDQIDDELFDLIERRMGVSEKIGEYKKRNNIMILQTSRWSEILQQSLEKGEQKGLSSDFVKALFQALHQESINHQEKIINT